MSAEHDRKFFDTFMLVLGILLGITIALIILARFIAGNSTSEFKAADPVLQREIAARIGPVAYGDGGAPSLAHPNQPSSSSMKYNSAGPSKGGNSTGSARAQATNTKSPAIREERTRSG